MLALSEKCDALPMRVLARNAFSLLFPTNLRNLVDFTPPAITGFDSLKAKADFKRTFAFEAINLIRDHELYGHLPMAYYHAAQHPIKDIMNGVESYTLGERITLSFQDKRKVLEGREALTRARRMKTYKWLNSWDTKNHDAHDANPDRVDKCESFVFHLLNAANTGGFLDRPNALDGMSAHTTKILEKQMCPSCWKSVGDLNGRYRMADKLPECFGWRNWDEVSDQEKEAEARLRL